MDAAEHRAYRRGYYAGMNRRWPPHYPTIPPHPVFSAIVMAAVELRDAMDNFLATLDPEDELEERFGPKIRLFDEAIEQMEQWTGEGAGTEKET